MSEELDTLDVSPYDVSAKFRLFHADLVPDQVSELFGLSPSHSHLKGEKRVNKSGKEYAPYNAGAWILSSTRRVRSLDANEHILWLLDELAHCHSAIHRLVEQGYRADIMCGWFANSDNTCPSLNAETIRRLAPVRVDFWFDVYLG